MACLHYTLNAHSMCINANCYMVVGNFKRIDSVLKSMSCLAAHLEWDVRFVTWRNPMENLWRRSSECNIRYVPWAASFLRLPQECPCKHANQKEKVSLSSRWGCNWLWVSAQWYINDIHNSMSALSSSTQYTLARQKWSSVCYAYNKAIRISSWPGNVLGERKPTTWWRYLDHIFAIWPHGEENYIIFMQTINSSPITIKFTVEWSSESVRFLDTKVICGGNSLITDLHTKSTDTHQYLYQHSCHPLHCKNSIAYSQALRIHRISPNTRTTYSMYRN